MHPTRSLPAAPAVPALIEALGVRGALLTAPTRRAPLAKEAAPAPRPRARATPPWSGSRPTSPACMGPPRGRAPSRTRSAGTRRSTATATVAGSTAASRSSRRSSRSPVGPRPSGRR
jgi:hypothetical protein